MGMAAILFNGAEPSEHPFNRPHVKSDVNWSSSFREIDV